MENNTLVNSKEMYDLKKHLKDVEKDRNARYKNIKRTGLWGGVFLLILGTLYGMYWLAANSTLNTPEISGTIEVTDADWSKGNQNAPLTIVEYSDFQCPACAAYSPIMEQLVQRHKDNLRLVYRHFPLRQIHANAQLAAQAAESAGKQRLFWNMHDMLFKNQEMWSKESDPTAIFMKYAKDIGANETQFLADLTSPLTEAAVNASYNNAVNLRINATPTFFLNGEKIQAPPTLEAFEAIIRQKLGQ